MARTYTVVPMDNVAGRFAVVDSTTGEVLSDAHGHGFKSKTAAYRSYEYYLRHVAK